MQDRPVYEPERIARKTNNTERRMERSGEKKKKSNETLSREEEEELKSERREKGKHYPPTQLGTDLEIPQIKSAVCSNGQYIHNGRPLSSISSPVCAFEFKSCEKLENRIAKKSSRSTLFYSKIRRV